MAYQGEPYFTDADSDNFDFSIYDAAIEEGSWGYLRSAVKDFPLHNTFVSMWLHCPV